MQDPMEAHLCLEHGAVAEMFGKTVNAVYVTNRKVRTLLKGEAKRLEKVAFCPSR